MLYGAVKLSPFGFKPTVTIVALLIALFAMILLGVSGQGSPPGGSFRQSRATAARRSAGAPGWARQARLVLAVAPGHPGGDEDPDSLGGLDGEWDDNGFVAPDDDRWLLDQDAEGVLE